MNRTYTKPPYERLVMKLKPVSAIQVLDVTRVCVPCTVVTTMQGSSFAQREQLINT
jgi:hypothetical protein